MSVDEKKLTEAVRDVTANAPLAALTTFKIAARAKFLATVGDTDELRRAALLLKSAGEKYFILGGGSNILVASGFYDGVAIMLGSGFRKISRSGDVVTSGAAVRLAALEAFAVKEGLSGLEPLSGIPGTVGGALAGNSGTRHGSISDTLESAVVLDENCRLKTAPEPGAAAGYRSSPLAGGVIVEASFRLRPDKSSEILKRINSFMAERAGKHPRLPSAGSVFKNPPSGPPAGKLIDDCGLKGAKIGGAAISGEHANFIVNTGSATAEDVLALMKLAEEKVLEKFAVKLEPEIKIIC